MLHLHHVDDARAMTKAGHTPGPWHRNIKPAAKYPTIYSATHKHVARVVGDRLRGEEIEANCDLITAATELLAALVGLLDWGCEHTSPRDTNSPHALLVDAAAAVAKARGEPCPP